MTSADTAKIFSSKIFLSKFFLSKIFSSKIFSSQNFSSKFFRQNAFFVFWGAFPHGLCYHSETITVVFPKLLRTFWTSNKLFSQLLSTHLHQLTPLTTILAVFWGAFLYGLCYRSRTITVVFPMLLRTFWTSNKLFSQFFRLGCQLFRLAKQLTPPNYYSGDELSWHHLTPPNYLLGMTSADTIWYP